MLYTLYLLPLHCLLSLLLCRPSRCSEKLFMFTLSSLRCSFDSFLANVNSLFMAVYKYSHSFIHQICYSLVALFSVAVFSAVTQMLPFFPTTPFFVAQFSCCPIFRCPFFRCLFYRCRYFRESLRRFVGPTAVLVESICILCCYVMDDDTNLLLLFRDTCLTKQILTGRVPKRRRLWGHFRRLWLVEVTLSVLQISVPDVVRFCSSVFTLDTTCCHYSATHHMYTLVHRLYLWAVGKLRDYL